MAPAPRCSGRSGPRPHRHRQDGVASWSHRAPSALGFERADDGFRVVVSRQLPRLLETNLPALVSDFIGDASDLDAIALHPGGQAIVDCGRPMPEPAERQFAATRRVLRRIGNTSSAAILFVLEELAAHLPVAGAAD